MPGFENAKKSQEGIFSRQPRRGVRQEPDTKGKLAFARFPFGGSPVRLKDGRCPMRKKPYMRIRRVLKITKAVLIIILLILTMVVKFKAL